MKKYFKKLERGINYMTDRRPDYPNCVMTPEVIRGVQERQRAWDREHPEEAKKYQENNS